MKVRVFRSGKGDCLLLTSAGGRNMLVDGGVFPAYKDHWAQFVGRMRDRGQDIDLACISHIDRDHIGGILRMLDNEVDWRVFNFRQGLPGRRRRRARRPSIKRPADVKAIWHNAFFETVRSRRLARSGRGSSSLDMDELLFQNAAIISGGGDQIIEEQFVKEGATHTRQLVSANVADRMSFLGQSVGDAIEVSRRIGAKQLNIPLNPEFGGDFVVRKAGAPNIGLGDFNIRVLGPTKRELDELEVVWDKWLDDKADFLKTLQRRHDRDAGRLISNTPQDILDAARQAALTLAGNQNVTPPNLASIIMLVRDGADSILLTGDADDTSIIEGLKKAGELNASNQVSVTTFKIPHHGAHNSYSDELARTVLAKNYVFCGNGKHDNPEQDVIRGFVEVLFEGKGGHPPALPAGQRVKFWFNSGKDFFPAGSKLHNHWRDVERLLERKRTSIGRRFSFRLMRRGDSFSL